MLRTTDNERGAYRLRLKVRFGECDAQGVVFNANYLAYVDDLVDQWLVDALGDDYQDRFDLMVKKATLEWQAPARRREMLDLRGSVTRWGNTSFDVTVLGAIDGRPIFEAVVVYISVAPHGHTPTPIPQWVRQALS